MGLNDLILQLSQSGTDVLTRNLTQRFRNINTYLNQLRPIRLFTLNSQNFGHQASTVNILRRLIQLGAPGPYELVLAGTSMADVVDLVNKIALLIPQFKPGTSMTFTLNGAQVTAVEYYPGTPNLAQADFCINGGFDDLQGKTIDWTKLNVINYVQLQPYAWHRGTNRVRIDDFDLPTIINLDEYSPHTRLDRRAFYVQPGITQDDWDNMLSGNLATQSSICQWLLGELDGQRLFLNTGYGFGTKSIGWQTLYNVVAGMRQSQVTLAPARRSSVLIALGVSQDDWSVFTDFVLFGEGGGVTNSANFDTFFTETISGKVKYVGSPNNPPTLQQVQDAVASMAGDPQKVLVVFLTKVPGPLFNYLYERASVPPLFEGQNTTELMLNLGKPYLKISSNLDDTVFGYPTLPLNSMASGTYATEGQQRAFNGVTSASPDLWFTARPTYPPTQLPPMTSAYLTPGGNALATYFTSLRTFFHDELNDKLLRALDLFVNAIGPGNYNAAVSLRSETLAAQQVNIVEALYLKFEEQLTLHPGVIYLLQALTSGDVYDFFKPITTDDFKITEAKAELNADKSVCTLTGISSAFVVPGIGAFNVSFEFTDYNDTGKLQTKFGAVFHVKWELPGADWLSISDPAFGFTMSEAAKVPFVGSMSAIVTAGLSAQIVLTVPVEPGMFELQAIFIAPRPSITNIFQLVGGVNLQQYLPSQLQLLSDIEVKTFTTRYNYTAGSVEMMGASLGTPPEKTWNLVPAVVVNSLDMNVAVVAPGDRVRRKTSFDITGVFGIGEIGPEQATGFITAYAPQLRVMGGLKDDSKPLKLATIVKAYLGQAFVDVLPQLVREAAISRLIFNVDQAAGRYSFGMTVDTLWDIPTPATKIFTVTRLTFDIAATSRAIDTANQGRTVVLIGGENAEPTGPSQTEITGSFGGNITLFSSAPPGAQLDLTVTAKYLGTNKGWTFSGQQTGSALKLGLLITYYLSFPEPPPEYNYEIEGLGLTTSTADGAWVFTAKATNWTVPFISGLRVDASVVAGYNPPKPPSLPAILQSTAALALANSNGCDGTGNFARIETTWRWNNISLIVWYDYCGTTQSFGITWDVLEALVQQRGVAKEWIGILRFKKGTTLGSMIERMVTWITGSAFALEAPWNVLNSITLNNLSLEYNFTRNTVSFNIDIGPIELGIARIDSISVVYDNDVNDPQKKKGVFVTLKGSFLWNSGPTANGNTNTLGPWDTSKPGTAPAPPGNGNKYLDLRLLALGQHVTATCFAGAKNVQGAIACLASLPDTKPGETPNIQFDPESSWLIGTEFGVLKFGDEPPKTTPEALMRRPGMALAAAPPPATSGYLLTLQIVFNDPSLYALRIALAGPAAKIFKGLDFQIMYRQISDSVGVYQAEITLPDIMRNLSIGAYSLTLPVFGISVYTNGDFQVDVGFPWNEDFTRSFTVEAIVPPGIPLLGSAGFYFGKLSSATTNRVPAATNGTFNPVIVFGFGMQVGVGKSIRYGILSAGFSITVFGIIEGVLAKWNPYQITDGGTSDNSQIQGNYYFWVRGTVGVIGKVFGTVDFAIIKADVNIEVKLMLQLTYESYVSIAITVLAQVSVSVSIKIDLGLFSITISFSFSMRLKETFTIENIGTPPWQVAAPKATSLLRAPANARLRSRSNRTMLAAGGAETAGVDWTKLAETTPRIPLYAMYAPALTIAHDEWDNTSDPKLQSTCYVGVMMIDAPAPPSTTANLTASAGGDDTISFDKLAKMVLRWAVAAKQSRSVTWQDVDAMIVTSFTLDTLIDVDLKSSDTNPTPIPPDAASEFMRRQFNLGVSLPPQSGVSPNSTFFPMAPDLTLEVNAWKTDPAYSYQFGKFNELDQNSLAALRRYFDELAVKVQQEQGTAPLAGAALDPKPLSMSDWILSDYFLLLMRQMVQSARDALRQFKYPLNESGYPTNPNGIVSWINSTGQLTGLEAYTLLDLFIANQAVTITTGKPVIVGAVGKADAQTLSFTSFAESNAQNDGQFNATNLALTNAAETTCLQSGKVVTYHVAATVDKPAETKTYTIKDGDSLISIARVFEVTINDLLINSDVLVIDVLRNGGPLLIPYVTYGALASDTFTTIANVPIYAGGFTPAALAKQNAGRPILATGVEVIYKPTQAKYTTVANDTLSSVAAALNVTLDQLLSNNNSNVLTEPTLIAPVAVIQLPSFSVAAAGGESLQTIIQRFAISMDVLALVAENGSRDGFFAAPQLDVPHLVQFQVGELLKEIQRSQAIAQLSGMTASYYLHGLRLPTRDDQDKVLIKPNTQYGIWVKDIGGTLTLPKYAGLFALTGQQFKVPVIPNDSGAPSFVVSLSRKTGPSWITFSGATDDKLPVTVAYNSTDAQRIRKVSEYATGGAVTIPLSQLGAGDMVQSSFSTYSFASSLLWQTGATVNLPYGDAPSGGVPSLRIWRMPDAMVDLPRNADLKTSTGIGKLPRFKARIARYDEATGATVNSDVKNYGWASTIEFTVKRVPEVGTSAANATTYELVGATGNSIQLLERIIEQVGSNDAYFDQLILAYPPEQTSDATEGVQTDAPAGVTLGLAQVNLSTITRPPEAGGAPAAALETGLGLLNPKSEFIQLLWTASITRAGGFYLYYYDSGEKRGLPSRVFNDRGEAALVLIVTYAKAPSYFTQNRLTNFMNAVAIAEAVETSNSIVFAEADPPVGFTLASADLGSLESISFDYYCDIGGLAEANDRKTLTNGKTVFVDEGVYQPPPGSPITVAQLEQRFNTTRAALLNANPRYKGNFPDPLVFPAAINLPRLELKVGTSPNSTSFSDIRAYYGQNIASLAADPDNRLQTPIFAAGQQIDIPGGPRLRSSNVPPGAQAVAAKRAVPAPVPLDPNAANYAQLFVYNAYSLLNYRFAPNLYFKGSNLGLPAGPQSKAASETNDKVVVPAPLDAVSTWDYKNSVPYSKFAITDPLNAAADLPSLSDNPYRGVGFLLQISFNWQDYYGNTLVTTLTSASSSSLPPYDQPPILTGYSDSLIGLGQWPSIAATFQVDAPQGSPLLQILMTFDASRYEGLMSAVMTNATTVVGSFTQPLDQASAETVANYTIAGGRVTAASLTDSRTVTLTIEPIQAEQVVLTVSNIESADKTLTFSGQATFAGNVVISSSLNRNATTALRTYQQLFYQLNDLNGIGWTIESTMLKQPITLTAAQITAIKQWLFDGVGGNGTSIYRFIADRAAWKSSVLPPAGSLTLDAPIDTANLNSEQIYLLAVEFILRRTGGAVLGDLETMAGITRSATEIAPLLSKVSAAEEDKTVGLTQFATLFQNALSLPGTYRLKIATGVDRRSVTTARNGSVLWVVRLGLKANAAEPIAFSINDAGAPVIFAPQPISNQLQSHTVGIRAYITGKGLSSEAVKQDFTDIDMDTWGRSLFGDVDGVLTPEFTSSTQIVGTFRKNNYLIQLLDQKKKLANAAKDWMIPAFEDESGADASRVREAYYQQMLAVLSSAYTTRAGVEYKAKVNASVNEAGYPITPRLFGPVTFASPRIVSASSSEQTLSMVVVVFSAPMDDQSTGNPLNYTISDGISVATAVPSLDGYFVTLTLGAPITLGKSTVTVNASLKDRQGHLIHPPLRVIIHRDGDVRDAASEITFSSPKLDLTVSPDTPLPFLVNAPENVRGGGGEIVATLDLDLVYNGTDIEHQISRPEGVEGYVASTWLSFVIRDEDWPLQQSLGTAQVPMPLRSFPTAPSMNSQSPVVDPNAADLPKLTKWAYDFTYSLPVHYPQDVVKCSVEFNINETVAAGAGFVDAFGPIAQFISVFPQVQADLVTYLAQVDATTDPASDTVVNAGVALETTIVMLRDITNAAAAAGSLTVSAKQRTRSGDPTLTYAFDIRECTINANGDPTDGALLVSLAVRQKAAGVGMPWVQVGDPRYQAVRYHGSDCLGASCDDDQRFCFVYQDKDGKYLTAAEGQLVPDRIVELPDLDLFQRQNAQATTKIERNAELVPGRKSAPPFIYTTSDVTFANALQPTVDSTRPYDVASVGSGSPVTRTLLDQLRNLFSVLLQYNQQPTLTMQVEATYEYVLNSSLPPVPLPILIQPPLSVKVKEGGGNEPPLDTVLTQWSEAITNWFQTTLPLGTSGQLNFSLTLMTNLVQPPMPLLWTRALQLSLDWIYPKLPTR